MNTRLASAFGLAMLAVAFSLSTSFACSETSHTTASVVESAVSESVVNITHSAETNVPEGQVGEVTAPAPIVSSIEAPPIEASAPPAIAVAEAIPAEITGTVMGVVPDQNSAEGAAIPASGIAGIEPSLTGETSQTTVPESEAKATAEVSEQTGTAEAQIAVADPGAVAAIEPPSSDVNAPPGTVSVDAVAVEITETVTVVVPGQTSENIDDVEITGAEPEHPTAAPNPNRDEATATLDDGK
jgi:hypothetical protein